MAKAKARKKKEPPPKVELAYTGEEALTRMKEFTRAIVNVPPEELARAKHREEKKRGH